MPSKKQITAYLKGGLGNQLFIYAANRALSLRLDAELVLDTTSGFKFDRVYQRSCELEHFSIPVEVSQSDQLDRWYRFRRKFDKMGGAVRSLLQSSYISEAHSDLSQVDLRSSRNRTDGHWTDERFFKAHADVIRKELQVATPLDASNLELAEQIRQGASVAIHVRRVQYCHTLTLDYYQEAIRRARAQVPNATFYCFSDDIEWCREELNLGESVNFIENRELPAIEDFHLMSLCRHFIIANSTFSWWAAWLGQAEGKLVWSPADGSGWAQPASSWELI